MAVKHKWYLKEKHRMIRNLFILDYRVHDTLVIIGILAFTLLIQKLTAAKEVYTPSLVVMIETWGGGTSQCGSKSRYTKDGRYSVML